MSEWGYVKNLPAETAAWVLENSKLRRAAGKERVYKFGGRPVSLAEAERKAKRQRTQEERKRIQGKSFVLSII